MFSAIFPYEKKTINIRYSDDGQKLHIRAIYESDRHLIFTELSLEDTRWRVLWNKCKLKVEFIWAISSVKSTVILFLTVAFSTHWYTQHGKYYKTHVVRECSLCNEEFFSVLWWYIAVKIQFQCWLLMFIAAGIIVNGTVFVVPYCGLKYEFV